MLFISIFPFFGIYIIYAIGTKQTDEVSCHGVCDAGGRATPSTDRFALSRLPDMDPGIIQLKVLKMSNISDSFKNII